VYHGLGLFDFVRNFSVRFSMRELGRETEKYSWLCFVYRGSSHEVRHFLVPEVQPWSRIWGPRCRDAKGVDGIGNNREGCLLYQRTSGSENFVVDLPSFSVNLVSVRLYNSNTRVNVLR